MITKDCRTLQEEEVGVACLPRLELIKHFKVKSELNSYRINSQRITLIIPNPTSPSMSESLWWLSYPASVWMPPLTGSLLSHKVA